MPFSPFNFGVYRRGFVGVAMTSYLVCPSELIGYHRVPPITIKEFLRDRPRCSMCQSEMKVVFDRRELSDEDKRLIKEKVKG